MIVTINNMNSFEMPNNEIPEETESNISRRDFLKQGLAFLAVSALTPSEMLGQETSKEAQEEKMVVDIVVDGRKITMRQKDIDRLQRTATISEEVKKEVMIESFDPEIQETIIATLGDKLREGLLKAQELGFSFNSRDTYHAHLLVDDALYTSTKEKYQIKGSFPKEEASALLKEVRALIFHCAELPSPSQLSDEKFWREKYPHRSIVVDEQNKAFDAIPKIPEIRQEGMTPDFNMGAKDYNELKGTNYRDLAEIYKSILEFKTDIKFIPTSLEDGGVIIDPRLPSFKFVLSGYKNKT